MNPANDVHSLFEKYANGEISAEQLRELENELRRGATLRREFMEYLNIDSALGDIAALSEAEALEIDDFETNERATTTAVGHSASNGRLKDDSRPTHRVGVIVGTIVAMLLVAATLWTARTGFREDPPVAMLVADIDADLLLDGEPWAGSELRAGEYRLDGGLLHLRFGGGVMVYVEAPARFEVVSDDRVVLGSGRLSANVPREGIGFTVGTPEAEVVDLGTEFSVDVETGKSEVHVFNGLVRVHPRSGQDDAIIDLRTSQAVRIEDTSSEPVEIALAANRFIRNFDEPRRRFPRSVKRLSPVAYYRMAIRDKGLAADPPLYSGVVLTGEGRRPPHTRGVIAGGSLRVQADSTGRGGYVEAPPSLTTGQFTLSAFVYLEGVAPGGVVATNMRGDNGSFTLSLDQNGRLQAHVRDVDGGHLSVTGASELPGETWRHVVVTVDGEQLWIYEDGKPSASTPCLPMMASRNDSVWFGADADELNLWNGRIDELALFDRALSDREIADLYESALQEMAKIE